MTRFFTHIPIMSHRPSGQAPSRLVAVLGPTNTGKTHLAVERMLGHASGMIGLPLRLLAREIYDRIVKARGPRAVALITGEEKIVPPRAHYFVCTVEAMPLTRQVEFLAVDEIQLAADPERGHVFTHRLLHARGQFETMLLGAATMAPLIRRLLPDAEIVTRERFSALTYAGPRKITRLPKRTAVVAFSADSVYAIGELIRRQRGGAAVVMGSLSPRTRNAQVELYQSGEVDFLVATDAIGMGLNMDVDHVAFAGLHKFDGRRARDLRPQEVAQIAGRAGRYRRDGTFGVTGGCEAMDDALVEAVENHVFETVKSAQWRNADLDFSSLVELMRSLSAPPSRPGLVASQEALDELTLRHMAADPTVAARCRDRSALLRLWDVCQTPDFRKTTREDHLRLVHTLFEPLGAGRRLAPDWMAGHLRGLDRTDGEIDALAVRLAGVRTLAYVANRPDWLADPEHWRETTRGLEDRLSDALHEKLMARFIDRRTSALLRGLGRRDDLLAGVARDGSVTVEGHFVGRLRGLAFEPAKSVGALEAKALRAAAERAVAPELARRLGALAADGDDAFALDADGVISWRGDAVAVLTGDQPFSPVVRLYGTLGPEPTRARAARRLEAFVAAEAGRRLAALKRLIDAVSAGAVKGLARGVAYRIIEAGGAIARSEVEAEVRALSQGERRRLRSLGVRIGTFSLFLPEQLSAETRDFAAAFATSAPPARALGLNGRVPLGPSTERVEILERLGELLRQSAGPGGTVTMTEAACEDLGWSAMHAQAAMRALGYAPVGKASPDAPRAWRRRRAARETSPDAPAVSASPFAALATLQPPRRPAKHRSARRKARPALG
jgi:ATP-dependent RNA helicase SUPV3L1/SUV3